MPGFTVEDLGLFPDHGFRLELHQGNLVIMAPAPPWHFDAIMRLVQALSGLDRQASGVVSIRFGPCDCRTADVAVFSRAADDDVVFFAPSDIVIVIEVVSPSSEEMDRTIKPRHYAQAGIPEFWRVERADSEDDATIYQHELVRTADGGLAYAQTRITTLVELEKSVE